MLAPTMFFADYGAHVRILEETRALQKLGHRVTILAYPNGRDIEGITVRRCWGVPFNYRVIVGSSRHKIYLDLLLAAMSLLHVISDKPDIIHAHLHEGALIGWVLSKLTRAPLVFDFQGSLTSEMIDHNFLTPNSPFYKFLRWLETQADHAADAILTSSVHAAKVLTDEYEVLDEWVNPTPDCVNADTFCADNFSSDEIQALKKDLQLPPDKKVIVYLGVLTPYQGIDILLQAVARLSKMRDDFHLLLMGYPGEARYKALSATLGVTDHVTFTGKIPYDQAPRYLALGDVATAPKVSATEGSGKILNYMAMGLPTVAFEKPVSREFLGDDGIFATDLNNEALAAALNRALDLSPKKRADIVDYLRRRVIHHYSWDRAAERIEAIYRALLAGAPLPTATFKTKIKSTSRGLTEHP
jgi:glycosyltransferase involved in cell wall biosynthesis